MNEFVLMLCITQPLTDGKPYKYVKGTDGDGKTHKVQIPSPLYAKAGELKQGSVATLKGKIYPHETSSGDVREYLTATKINKIGESEIWKK